MNLLDLLDIDVIQVFMTYTDASRHFSFCFLGFQVAGGIKLVGMISPVFRVCLIGSETRYGRVPLQLN